MDNIYTVSSLQFLGKLRCLTVYCIYIIVYIPSLLLEEVYFIRRIVCLPTYHEWHLKFI